MVVLRVGIEGGGEIGCVGEMVGGVGGDVAYGREEGIKLMIAHGVVEVIGRWC